VNHTRLERLAPQMEKVSEWLNHQDTYPEHWRRNIDAFLRKMVAEFPNPKAWTWLTRTFGRFEVKQPFGWVRKVLQDPWLHFPEERRQSAFSRVPPPPQGKGKDDNSNSNPVPYSLNYVPTKNLKVGKYFDGGMQKVPTY
jgi:hypothetical protein